MREGSSVCQIPMSSAKRRWLPPVVAVLRPLNARARSSGYSARCWASGFRECPKGFAADRPSADLLRFKQFLLFTAQGRDGEY